MGPVLRSVTGRHCARSCVPVSTRHNAGHRGARTPLRCLPQEGDAMKTRDAIDDQLIALLQDNARLSTVALAKAVGLSRSTVQERLQRLEQAGVIAQYTVRLGSGGDPLQAWLLLRYADSFSCDDVMPVLAAMPEVQICHSVAGEIDLLVL